MYTKSLPAGCFVVTVAVFLESLSAFGRSSALSPFLKQMGVDLSLSMTQMSGVYSLANVVASLLLPWIGYIYHRQKASHFAMFFVVLFALSFFCMSGGFLENDLSPFYFLFLIFMGIRLSVQAYGVLEKSMIATWFSKHRGFATGCSSLILTFVTSVTPSLCYSFSQNMTWQTFARRLGIGWLFWITFCCYLRKPDLLEGRMDEKKRENQKNLHGILWLFLLGTLFLKAFQNSGIAFHLVPLCHDFYVDPKKVSMAFLPISMIAVFITFLTGHFFSYIGPKASLWIFLLSNLGMLYAIQHFAHPGMIHMFIFCTGIYWGINNIIAAMVIPALFGVSRIGVLQGWAYSVVTFGSAIGPFYFGIMKDKASYQIGLTVCICLVIMLLLIFLKIQEKVIELKEN